MMKMHLSMNVEVCNYYLMRHDKKKVGSNNKELEFSNSVV